MRVGTQFTGTLAAGQSGRWTTWGWPADWHVTWYFMPTTPAAGAPELEWEVDVERSSATQVTYWLTVRNLSAVPMNFEGRYAVLN